jgi:hypothetical protein
MTAIAKHRDLLSAGLALGFVVFVLASVAVRTFTHPVAASNAASIKVPANPTVQN